ncbi:hypothetical protein Glove_48g132 [Diversispora epigaea]|uniref:Uncharacterized protein n=1 Tax=Diversispora epigaea TaxID=1348612 RepID=A0A397JHA5_9GLOM|nr:hypothetical protein Glove_48g132 [Diversispora epigaea]
MKKNAQKFAEIFDTFGNLRKLFASFRLIKFPDEYYLWAEIWKAHRIGIQFPDLNKKLQCVEAYKLPNLFDNNLKNENSKHICFGFDEALETFGVRFIKQNITGNTINENNLKMNIKAAQTERERIDFFLSEFLEDTSISQSPRAIDARKESL